MLNKNPATKKTKESQETKKNRTMYLVGYTTYILSSNWRGNDLPKDEGKGGEIE